MTEAASPRIATGSVIKGSTVLIVSRAASMAGGFLLFLFLTWRSAEAAGVFRTVATFLAILELLPLLGMQRWLAAEIARRAGQSRAVFALACRFAVGVGVLGGIACLVIAASGAYGAEISACLRIVALATIPSAINLCVMSALVGLGYSHQAGLLSFAEVLARSVPALVLIVRGFDLVWVIAVFVVVRWVLALLGLMLVQARVAHSAARIGGPLARDFLHQIPNLALSMVGFLAIRNAAMLLLPLFRGEAEAGVYAAPFQLFDLMLLVPTVLTISTNYLFVESAGRSLAALRDATRQLIDITSVFVLPSAILGIVLAQPLIGMLFGPAYRGSVLPLRLLLAAAVALSLDQIFALGMVVSGNYRADRTCVIAGALVTIGATCLLAGALGAAGAAAAVLLGIGCTLALRLYRMRRLVRLPALAASVREQAFAAALAGLAAGLALPATGAGGRHAAAFGIVSAVPGLLVYALVLYWRGGLSRARLQQVQAFMVRRG